MSFWNSHVWDREIAFEAYLRNLGALILGGGRIGAQNNKNLSQNPHSLRQISFKTLFGYVAHLHLGIINVRHNYLVLL